MSVQRTQEQDTSLAELDPDQLTDSDELYHMAQAMRDDDYFEVPIVDWEKQNDAVMVTIITPNGETATVQETWPEKPTTDNNFIRACMCALNVDSAKDAALMADDLQNVSHADFTVPADKASYNGWELHPEVETPERLVDKLTVGDGTTSKMRWRWRFAAVMFGPVAIFLALSDTIGGDNWDSSTTAGEQYWKVQGLKYSTLGIILWFITLFLM